MSITRRDFLAAGGFCATTAVLTGCSRGRGDLFEKSLADLEKHIVKLMEKLQVPGVSIAIIRDAGIVWSRGFGVRDRTTRAPVNDDTIFSAQSMSKPVFAYRVMKLCELGVLDLDTPLTNYTSDVFVKGDPRLKEITARRVLSHTTGLPNWRSREDPLKINFPPGSKWSYSGEGYHYLQSVVTQRTGHTDQSQCGTFELDYRVCATDFGEYMEANLLRPFGMNSSGYVLSPELMKKSGRFLCMVA